MRKKRGAHLGQHFLKNPTYARLLAHSVHTREGETILEVGPGTGVLTKELLATGAHVVAIEKDPALVEVLRRKFPQEISCAQLQLVAGDVRDFDPAAIAGTYALAANIPYYITGEIIRQFLTAEAQPRTMALLIQKEVAERIVARDGKESLLSISVKAYGEPKIVAKVSKGNFSPPPSVDSAILLIEQISKTFFDSISEERFFDVLHAGFAGKRKMLAGKTPFKDHVAVLGTCGISEKARAEDVALAQWQCLALSITN